jgi:hypothetical protein
VVGIEGDDIVGGELDCTDDSQAIIRSEAVGLDLCAA